MSMRDLIQEKLSRVTGREISERFIELEGDDGLDVKVAVNPTTREIDALMSLGHGLRLIVGADDLSDQMLAWAGSGDGGAMIGAMHEGIGDQYGLSLIGTRHVPLSMSPAGKMKVTLSVGDTDLSGPRDAEDVLDRNKWFRKRFGDIRVNYSALRDAF